MRKVISLSCLLITNTFNLAFIDKLKKSIRYIKMLKCDQTFSNKEILFN